MKRITISIFMLLVSMTIVSAFDCSTLPGEWIKVPGSAYFGTTDFCVMKYEAKNVGGVATSQAAGTPWVSINFTDAWNACNNLGEGYHMITNREWMTIARNAEQVGSNWNTGVVGNGSMFKGHSDNSPSQALSASTNDNDGYYGTGNDGNSLQRRTYKLSNEAIIWDFAGNVYQWVDLIEDGSTVNGGACGIFNGTRNFFGTDNFGYQECTWGNGYAKTYSIDKRFEIGPYGSYNSDNGVGLITAYNANGRAVRRGGLWGNEISSGPFAIWLSNIPSVAGNTIGLRCTYTIQFNLPTYQNFESHPETTNFSSVVDVTAVDNPVLATTNAKVQWNAAGMNFNGADLDSAVNFAPNLVSIRSDLLPVLNANATIEFKNVNYAGLESFNVLKDGELCVEPECVKISATPATVEVSGFSNYTTQGTGEVPEFNAVTLIIGLIVITVGVVAVRRNRK